MRGARSLKRGYHFDRDGAKPVMIAAARKFLKKRPVDALSFRSLAESNDRRFTPTAPLHHFGSRAGLLGAIADECFRELTDLLNRILERKPEQGSKVVSDMAK